MWVVSKKTAVFKVTSEHKNYVEQQVKPVVEKFKQQYILPNPDLRFNYVIDIYTKWYRNYFYFCEKFQSEYPNRITGNFEVKFTRLECTANDRFNLAFLRHNDQWCTIAEEQILIECLQLIENNSMLHPI